jgi:hypothetical protein
MFMMHDLDEERVFWIFDLRQMMGGSKMEKEISKQLFFCFLFIQFYLTQEILSTLLQNVFEYIHAISGEDADHSG